MNCSRKISAHWDANLRGHSREHQHGTEAAIPAPITSRGKKREGFAPTGSCFRTIWLAALVLAVVVPVASAEITLLERNSDAKATAFVTDNNGFGHGDFPEPKIQMDFLPANLSNSAAFTIDGVTATGNSTSVSSISLNSSTNTLTVTGNGTGAGTLTVPLRGSGSGAAQVIRLVFHAGVFSPPPEGTGNLSSTFSVTGQLSASSDTTAFVTAKLVSVDGMVFFMEGVGTGFATNDVILSGSGTLPPGEYVFQVDLLAASDTDAVSGNGSADFELKVQQDAPPCGVSHHIGPNGQDIVTVDQCGLIQWNNPAGGSFATKENWNPQTTPGLTDTAVFGLGTTYSVDVGTVTTDRLEVSGGAVTFTNANYSVNAAGNAPPSILIDNGTLTLASGNLSGVQGTVGQTHAATVTLEAGATLSLTTLSIGGLVQLQDGGLLDVDTRIDIGPQETTGPGILVIGDFPPFGDGGGVAQTMDCVVFRGSLGVHGQGTTGARLDVADLLSIGGLSDIITPPTSSTSGLITGGAVVVAQRFALGDRERSSSAILTISGVGGNGQASLLNVAGASPSLLVGGAPGTTRLEVSDGGMLISSDTQTIGSELLVGKVLVHGKSGSQPSTWSASDFVLIGSQVVPSELVVQEGGVVSGDAVMIFGEKARELGRMTIAGGDSSLTADEIVVGENGDGELTVSDGGHVTSALARVGAPTKPDSTRGTGVVIIQGTLLSSSEWHNTDSFVIGLTEPGTFRLEGETIGPFSVGGATLTVDSTLTVGPKGFVRGNGTVVAAKLENDGSIGPDVDIEAPVRGKPVLADAPVSSSGGIIAIEGDYEQQADGKLTIDTAGIADGEFDFLHVTGNATLGGTLEMLFPGAYLPKTGDSFQFLQVDGTISGEFAEITFPQLLPGFQFDTMQVPGGLLFTALNDAVLAPTFLLNISTRLQVGTDDNVLIGGFILLGTEPKRVLIRAIGPSLEAAGVSGALADPTLELHDSTGALIGQNDDWRETLFGGVITEDQFFEIFETGIPPTRLEESAIIATLEPGAYTAIIAASDGTTGVGLAEVYDLGPAPAPAKLANISTRGLVQTGDDVMIGGFIIGNQTSEVLVRGIGPSLAALGVDGALADPMLELHDVNGTLLASNDNWRSDQEAEIEATTIPPNDDLESAILRTLAPGAYTAILRGVGDATGVGLVEAYNLD